MQSSLVPRLFSRPKIDRPRRKTPTAVGAHSLIPTPEVYKLSRMVSIAVKASAKLPYDVVEKTNLVDPINFLEKRVVTPLVNARSEEQFDRIFDRTGLSPLHRKVCAGWWARNQMIAGNMLLVAKIAEAQFRTKNIASLELDDLINEGAFGTSIAIGKFDPKRKNQFSTHAYWWIMQSVSRHIVTADRAVRLPGHRIDQASKIKRAKRALELELGRSPSPLEISERTGDARITPALVVEMRAIVQSVKSLDKPLKSENPETHLDFLQGKADPDLEVADELESIIRVANLSTAQEIVIRELIEWDESQATNRLQAKLGLTKQRISQLKIAAMERLTRAAKALATQQMQRDRSYDRADELP